MVVLLHVKYTLFIRGEPEWFDRSSNADIRRPLTKRYCNEVVIRGTDSVSDSI